jgi:hypothetical protein
MVAGHAVGLQVVLASLAPSRAVLAPSPVKRGKEFVELLTLGFQQGQV